MLHDQDALVLIDTPPLLGLTDAAALAASVDAVVLVTRAGYSTRRSCRNALDLLAQVGAPVLGTVLTRSQDDESIGSYTERLTHRRRRHGAPRSRAGAANGGLESLTRWSWDCLRVAVALDARQVCAWQVGLVARTHERARDRAGRGRVHRRARACRRRLGRSSLRIVPAARAEAAMPACLRVVDPSRSFAGLTAIDAATPERARRADPSSRRPARGARRVDDVRTAARPRARAARGCSRAAGHRDPRASPAPARGPPGGRSTPDRRRVPSRRSRPAGESGRRGVPAIDGLDPRREPGPGAPRGRARRC